LPARSRFCLGGLQRIIPENIPEKFHIYLVRYMKPSIAFTLLIATAIARGDNFDTWFGTSPDKKLSWLKRRVLNPNEPSRFDLESSKVFVFVNAAEKGVRRWWLHQTAERIADSIRENAVSFSSARTTKRFPSRCASAIQIRSPFQIDS